MTKQTIFLGTTANDRTGDPLRVAFEKVNENFDELYARTGDDIQIPALAGNNGKVLTVSGGVLSWQLVSSDSVSSIEDFGEGFSLTGANKIVTNKLYSTNLTQPNQHYRLELDTNGVVRLPDQSIINGATLKSVAGNYAGITAGPVGKDEDSWMWVDSGGAWIATDYSTNGYTWQFYNDGNLRLPSNSSTVSGIIHTFASSYNSTTPPLVSATNINLVDNNISQSISTGWVITFANSVQKTVTVSEAGPGSWDLEWSGALSLTGSDVWPLTVQSADYTAGNDTTSGAIIQRSIRTLNQGFTTVLASESGVIYSALDWQTGFKLTIMVETRLDNNTDDVNHTQLCEAIIAANYNSNTDPVMSVYGLTYTSPDPLATFEIQRTGNFIEVVANNPQTQYNLQVNVHAVQFGSYYD